MRLQNPFRSKPKFGAVIIHEKSWKQRMVEKQKSSSASATFDGRVMPPIPFKKRNDFYVTIGRLQNTVDSLVFDVINRDKFYDDQDGHYPEAIKLMENWESNVQFPRWIGSLMRNWLINGVFIPSVKDWIPLQMESLVALIRDDFGDNLFYVVNSKGTDTKLPAKDFIWIPYIDHDRQPWPTGMFESLMREFEDIDGFIARPLLELYRQSMQDILKIHHKYASPRVIYTFPGVDAQTIDEDIAPLIEAMKPGDRLALNISADGEIQLITETVDGKARFSESIDKLTDEIDTGLQTSKNRLITKPSAMADAREAGEQDDDRVLGLMERIKLVMDTEIIPRVTGLEPGKVMYKWGSKAAHTLVFPEPLKDAIKFNILTSEQVRRILEKHYDWEIPEPLEGGGFNQPPGNNMPEPPMFPVQPGRTVTIPGKSLTPSDNPGTPMETVSMLQYQKEKTEKNFLKSEIKSLIRDLTMAQVRTTKK